MLAADALDDIAPQTNAAMAARSEADPRVRPIDWNRFFQTARNGRVPADAGDAVEFMDLGDWLLVGESVAGLTGRAFIIILQRAYVGEGRNRLRNRRKGPGEYFAPRLFADRTV